MIEVQDNDLELLESYLDEELSPEQVEAVEGRLAAEPSLTLALERLRLERGGRRDFWQAMESDPAADGIVRRVAAEVRRERRRGWQRRLVRPLVAVAAGVMLFLGGWMGRGWVMSPRSASDGDVREVRAYQVTIRDEWGHAVVQKFDTREQAEQFVADLGQWQQRQEQIHSGQVVVVADRF